MHTNPTNQFQTLETAITSYNNWQQPWLFYEAVSSSIEILTRQ